MYRIAQFSIVVFCFLVFSANGQQNEEINSSLFIEGKFDQITADPLGYIYAVQGDEIFKFDQKGDTLYQQSTKQYGLVTTIDASQSMRILFYFEEQQAIGFTDNTLSWHKTPQPLNSNNIPFPTAVCQSFLNNNLWVYDDASLSLLKLNAKLDVIQRNENLPAMLNRSFHPTDMLEQSDKLYVLDTTSGVFVFDLFGSISKMFDIKGIQKIDVRNKKIYYLKNDKLYPLLPLEPIHEPIPIPSVGKIKDFALLDKKIAILTAKGIYIISLKS